MVRLIHYSDIENVYDTPERAGRLAGLLSELDGPDALVVGSGDNTSPGVLPLVSRGRQALDFFRAAGVDVETFGNHDFDYGPDATRQIVADSSVTWVGANVYDGDGERFAREEGAVPHAVFEVDGRRVGVFGVTDPATASLNPEASSLDFTDPIPEARQAIDALRDRGVDHVLAVSHLGSGDRALAELEVDAVLGGHVHSERIDRLNGAVLTRPGVNGHVVLEVELSRDGTDPAVTRHAVENGNPVPAPLDEGLVDALERRRSVADLGEVVTRVDEQLPRDAETVHGGECAIGNFIADAYRAASGADVGLQNSGGIRPGEPIEGAVTIADLISLVPFEEPVVTVRLTGAELRETFRQLSATEVNFGEDHWWHGHLSGASVVFDAGRKRLLEARVGGEPLEESATYTLATTEYVLHSDQEFPAIGQRHRAGEHGIQHEVLAAYARDRGIDVGLDGRIRQR
ncbi:5'-nucleotidase/2',3'-cyclic nucleotide 2'-phosphodiesterase [Halalkaliarchaeum desulfuricum]|uniref:5'-nucleotidase/2',3'-cyclic nucleotide 2'-phosphodiesterase n=1 Tax=Halalkaliarchaeum desulfuricum TaxID=2055893 RepID=A0A343TLR2_9EURY|nr:bifunctional metallophosphatase/5'-nucleotidase [Halalkaliarchaeum desulfuricum]AUX10034.1 5'-nucleotidase/2',3'-cyclic nucleotide 2'-phosphodiesterase [Halalkaliarchaeum desulfuricum]